MQTQLVSALNYLAHGSKTRPIESCLCLRGRWREESEVGEGQIFSAHRGQGARYYHVAVKTCNMKKTYAWVFCADIVVPSCACRFCPPAYVSLPYLVCLVRYLRLFNHYLCSIHLKCFQVVLILLV